MSKPEDLKSNLLMADIDMAGLLEGETPRLLDEWQIAPSLWDAIRFEIDHRGGVGYFILKDALAEGKTNDLINEWLK